MSTYRVDGLAVVTDDADRVAERWESLLGAMRHESAIEPSLGALRTRLHVGNGAVDIFSPSAPGIIESAFRRRGEHLFASAISTTDDFASIDDKAMAASVPLTDGSILLPGDTFGAEGISIIVRRAEKRPSVGRIRQWYEGTMLVDDFRKTVLTIAGILGLDTSAHCVLESDEFGYNGILTLFEPGHLSRFEIVTPWSKSSTMNRFYKKNGQCLYMAFGESDHLVAVGGLLNADGFDYVKHSRDGAMTELWIPPAALGGVMVGMSVPNEAWRWSSGEPAFGAV
jgi:hypothetical protein